MKNRVLGKTALSILSSLVLLTGGLASTQSASASNPVVGIEGMNFDVQQNGRSNLKALHGQRVGVMLSSGELVSGRIKAVGQRLLHLENLGKNKEFMNALIVIDNIVGIEAQFRGYLRDVERAGLTPVMPKE